jgi:hypothetical protein
MIDNQENEPEVGYHVRLWFVFALSHLNPGEVALIKTAAPIGRYAFQGKLPAAASSSSHRGPPKPTPIVLSTPCNTGSSQQVEKAKFQDSPMDDSEVEIIEDSPATLPTVTTPRPSQRQKTVIRQGPKVTAEAAEQLPGPQAIHPVGSPDPPLSLERLKRLKSVFVRATIGSGAGASRKSGSRN